MPLPRTTQPPARIQIQAVEPIVDCGRYPVKRTVGDTVDVYATVFKDGHDTLGACDRSARARRASAGARSRSQPLGNDRCGGAFAVDRPGRWQFAVAAWTDRIATWQDELRRKVDAGEQDLSGELSEGAALLGRTSLTLEEALAAEAGDRHGEVASGRSRSTSTACSLASARGTSSSRAPGAASAASRRCCRRLAELGFDVVYLPPIHPIGMTNRKGRNNAIAAGPDDVGSPWAIGSADGGHDAIDPALGTWADFDAMVAAAKDAGVELALDFAIQCSPDHPWLSEHPEWFNRRPDGTLKYAENPPKRYQDIYNVNFESEDWQGLWQALLDVVLGWVRRGITVFRVDNPHTKPAAFWEWLIREVRTEHPEVIFLSEAFTRPSMMTTLAKLGFAQSYTYFTWKNTKAELVEYMEELESWTRSTGRTRSRTRRTSSTSTCSSAARPRSRRGSCWPRRSRRPTGSTPGSSRSRTCRWRPARRSTSTRRSTRCERAHSTARCCRSCSG